MGDWLSSWASSRSAGASSSSARRMRKALAGNMLGPFGGADLGASKAHHDPLTSRGRLADVTIERASALAARDELRRRALKACDRVLGRQPQALSEAGGVLLAAERVPGFR